MKVKNLFLSMLAVAGMLAVASCSQDDFLGGNTTGDYVDATFTVSTADGIGTRATIGNGETVNKVACTVYDAKGNELDLYQIVDVQADRTATYNVRLAKGQAYRVAFFAYYGDENSNSNYYTVNDLKNIEVKEGQFSNIEERDAFTANYEVTKEMSMNSFNNEEPIKLKRPFAQLNLGTDAQELEAARKSGIVISESEIKVSNVYNAFSAYHNAVVKTAVAAPMTFKLNAIPTEMLEVELNGIEGIQDDEKFTYLAMNYLLVGDLNSEKTLTDVEFIWATADGNTNDPITSFPNVRTQRNYRTNILGKFITNPAEFNLVIDERFDGNIDNYGIVVKNNNVTAVQPLIVRKMTAQNNTIALEGNNSFTVSGTRAALDAYQVIITNGSDDAEYVKPTGTYTLTGADNLCVYPRDYYAPVASWDEFTAALAAGEGKIVLTEDITYSKSYDLKKDVTIDLCGKSLEISDPALMLNIHSQATVKNGTIKGKVYARTNSNIVFDGVTFGGSINGGGSIEASLQIQGACNVYANKCSFNATNSNSTKSRPLSIQSTSSGTYKFVGCSFKSNTNQNQVYVNPLSGTATLDFTNCNFNNKTPNIMFAATCPLTNLTMSGTTKLSSVTLETNRAKDAVTAEDLAYLRESLIANNSMSSVRLFYAGGSSEYIR